MDTAGRAKPVPGPKPPVPPNKPSVRVQRGDGLSPAGVRSDSSLHHQRTAAASAAHPTAAVGAEVSRRLFACHGSSAPSSAPSAAMSSSEPPSNDHRPGDCDSTSPRADRAAPLSSDTRTITVEPHKAVKEPQHQTHQSVTGLHSAVSSQLEAQTPNAGPSDGHSTSKLTRDVKPPLLGHKPVVVVQRRQRSDSSSDAGAACVPSCANKVTLSPTSPAAAGSTIGMKASSTDRRSVIKSFSFTDRRTSSSVSHRDGILQQPIIADGGDCARLPFRELTKSRSPPPLLTGVGKPPSKPVIPPKSSSINVGQIRNDSGSHMAIHRTRSHNSATVLNDKEIGMKLSEPLVAGSPTAEVGVRSGMVLAFARRLESGVESCRTSQTVGHGASPPRPGIGPKPRAAWASDASTKADFPDEPVGAYGNLVDKKRLAIPTPSAAVAMSSSSSTAAACDHPATALLSAESDADGYLRPCCMHAHAGETCLNTSTQPNPDCCGGDAAATAGGDRRTVLSHHHYSDILEGDSTSKSSTLASACSSHVYDEVVLTVPDDDDLSSTCSSAGGDGLGIGRVAAGIAGDTDVFCDTFDSVLDSVGQSAADEQAGSSSDSDSEEEPEQSAEDKKKRKAYLVAKEMMKTEAEFCDNLKLLNEDFRNFVTSGSDAETNSIVPGKMLDRILNYLPQLQDFSNMLTSDLTERVEHWESNPLVADVFVKKGPFLRLYTTYIMEFEKATAALDEAMKVYPAFAEKVREFEATERCRHLLLRHFMLKPIQRIPQYKLLLTDYLKYVSEEHPDHASAVEALAVVSKVASHSNEAMKQDDNLRELLDIQNSLVGDFKVIEPSRKLLKKGELLKHSRHDKQARLFFLFNDVLLIASPMGNMCKQKYVLRLEELKTSKPVVDKDDYESEFTIINRQKSFAVVARSAAERDAWFDAINRAIEDRREKLQSFLPGVQLPIQRDFDETAIGEVAPVWIPDARVSMCMICNQQFTVLFRRHHCRGCGKVVCKQCSECKAPLKYSSYGAQRVCVTCYDVLYKRLVGCYEKTQAIEGPRFPRKDSLLTLFRGPTAAPPHKALPTRLAEVSADDAQAFSGYLRMLTKKFHWKRFWFVVKDHVLYRYNASQDTAAIDSTVLFGYEVVGFTEPFDSEPAELLLKLHKPETSLIEPVVFRAESADGAARWLSVLKQNTQP